MIAQGYGHEYTYSQPYRSKPSSMDIHPGVYWRRMSRSRCRLRMSANSMANTSWSRKLRWSPLLRLAAGDL